MVTFERIQKALETKNSGMMILDLSNPRTVDEKVAQLRGIKLMNIDQIAKGSLNKKLSPSGIHFSTKYISQNISDSLSKFLKFLNLSFLFFLLE